MRDMAMVMSSAAANAKPRRKDACRCSTVAACRSAPATHAGGNRLIGSPRWKVTVQLAIRTADKLTGERRSATRRRLYQQCQLERRLRAPPPPPSAMIFGGRLGLTQQRRSFRARDLRAQSVRCVPADGSHLRRSPPNCFRDPMRNSAGLNRIAVIGVLWTPSSKR